jgi:serine/threonine protein kinase
MDDDGSRELADSRVGTTIAGCYKLNRLIGLGGAGAVYEATALNGKRVALKVLHPSLSKLPDIRERFHREALIARRIFHPGVARILDDGASDKGDVYIAMELLEGESIETRAERTGGALPLNEVIAIAAAALEVLDAAHRVGVVHRDLKPDNLFLTIDRTLKVLDFGIARLDTNDRLVKRTQNGVIMGTPAFMAPEQAKASWGQVDKRTDVWAMGAIMFTLLAGRPVHPGGSVGEVIAAASMRPATSLGRVVRAPIPIVRVVDRALAFDQHERYADAAEMRAALLAGVEEMRHPPAAGEAPTPSRGAAPAEIEALEEREPGEAGASPFAIIEATDEQRKSLKDLWKSLELALLAVTQYGMGHPETDKRLAQTVAFGVAEVARTQSPIQWNITPYSFTAGGVPVWEPDTPYDRVPYQLFADGIRIVTLLPGLAHPELDSFLRLVIRDRFRELAPEDDFVTLLWESDFSHVTYQAIDSFGTGDLTRRSRFENDVRGIQALGQGLPRGQISKSFARKTEGRSAAASSASVLQLLGKEGVDASAIVKAEAMLSGRDDVSPRPTLDLTAEMKRVLSARLSGDAQLVEPKFARSVALAWTEARTSGATLPLSQKLRAAIDGMAVGRPDAALRAATAMCATAGAAESELLRAVVSSGTMKKVLAFAKTHPTALDAEALKAVVLSIDGACFDVVLEAVLAAEEGPLKDLLVGSYLTRPGLGNEARLGPLFKSASEETGLVLARMLGKLDTKEAKAALALAAGSPSGIVRIEALGSLEGANSDRMRVELKALLEDGDGALRMTALRTMEKNAVRLAGPSLVLRIKSGKFDSLPIEERRQALRTLAALAPRRAEEVAVELLSNAGLLPSESHEQSRILAAELLGSIAQTEAAKDALAAAESSRWRSSEPLRVAAENARKRLTKMPQNPWAVPPSASGASGAPPPPSKTNAPPLASRPSVGPEKGRK